MEYLHEIELNPSNWVSLEDIQRKIEQIQNERYPMKKIKIKIGEPKRPSKETRVYIFSMMNHSFGVLYRSEDKTGYIYDSENIFNSDHPLDGKLRHLKNNMRLTPINCNYRSRNDFCGSQIVAATLELLSWHHRNYIPSEIRPSPTVRKRVETIFHKEPSAREARLGVNHYRNLKKIHCPMCQKLIKRKGSNSHLISCRKRIARGY